MAGSSNSLECEMYDKIEAKAKEQTTDKSKVLDIITRCTVKAFLNTFELLEAEDNGAKPVVNRSSDNHHGMLPSSVPKKIRSCAKERCYKKRVYYSTSLSQDDCVVNISSRNNEKQQKREEKQAINAKKIGKKRCFEVEDVQEREKKKLKRSSNNHLKKATHSTPLTPPQIPLKLKTKIDRREGIDVKLVIEKQIYASDLKRSQDRFTIPVNQIRNLSFLNEREQRVLKAEEGTVSVKVLEPCDHESNMVLKQWNLQNCKTIALRTSWNALLNRNQDEFKEGDIVQLWSFRVKIIEPVEEQEQHWLALVNLTRVKESGEEMVIIEQN